MSEAKKDFGSDAYPYALYLALANSAKYSPKILC